MLLSTSCLSTPSLSQALPAGNGQTSTDTSADKTALNKTDSGAFELGLITIYGEDKTEGVSGQSISQTIVDPQQIRLEDRNTLDDALSVVPGVSLGNTGGSRNERLLFVRGFDRFQVPLSIDGIRVYLPADNRLDFGRFLTPDLAAIQVQKGYVSVLSGPGSMGGAINLVTRKPEKPFEAELQGGLELGNTGKPAAYTTYGSVGTRQDMFYLQASGAWRDVDGWFLSRKFDPTPVENGGGRDFSAAKDWRINLKAGFTPNATDEYVISYTAQAGEKDAPYSVNEPVRGRSPLPLQPGTSFQRDWRWPQWDVSSLAFYSHTQVGEASYVKTKAYYNTFENLLSAFDDSSFSSQRERRSFDSYYDDSAYGVSVEAGTDLIPMNSLKVAGHYRRDDHTSWNHNTPDISSFVDPKQTKLEDTWSLAVENTFHATDQIDLVAGASYDRNKLKKAEDYDSKRGIYSYPLGSSEALNWQTAAIYRPITELELHASVSSRTRFPTLFERFSTRFGDATPNPDLKAERAINYELGGTYDFSPSVRTGGALFYSDVEDMIQSISVGNGLVQNQNIGDGKYYGIELNGEWDATSELTLGANYTYLKREINDPVREGLKPVGSPEHTAFLYANWRPYEKLTVSPSVQISSSRWSTDRLEENYLKTDGFVLANLNFEYQFNEHASTYFGVRNIFDKNYELVDGFPEAGRTFHVMSRIKF